MSELAKDRLLSTLKDLREEQAKLDRMADADSLAQAKGIDFAVSEIVAALRIAGEEQWTSEVDHVGIN